MLVRFANKLFHHEDIKPLLGMCISWWIFLWKKGEENREK